MADTLGVDVYRVRYLASMAGRAHGHGRAFLSTGLLRFFSEDMVACRGYIALAAVIFGRYKPGGVLLSPLLFTLGNVIANVLQTSNPEVPYNLLVMIPYVLTIVVLAAFGGKAVGPAAAGKPYQLMTAILEMRDICKRFPGGVTANEDVCLRVEKRRSAYPFGGERRGQIHADEHPVRPVPANQRGNLPQRRAGALPVRPGRHGPGHRHVASAFHAHPVPERGGKLPHRLQIGQSPEAGRQDRRKQIEEVAARYNMEVRPAALVEDLSIGERQRVEIIKMLMRGTSILILDEPTAVLTPQETQQLFKMIRSLTAGGYTVLFISHKLHEIKGISDRITILRQGKLVATTCPRTGSRAA